MRASFALAVSSRVLALVLATVSFGACTTTPDKPAAPTRSSRDYYPLAVGNRWSYAITPAPPELPPQEVKILDKDGAGFFVDSQGGKLAPRTDGIFDGLQGRYLLQEPVTVGHEWIAVPSEREVERFVITSVDTAVQVKAGAFVDCVVVESKSAQTNPMTKERGTFTMTASYAPGVGLVQIVQRFKPDGKEEIVVGQIELVSFDVKPTE